MAMTTSELQAEIEATKLRLQAARTRSQEIDDEIDRATERQRLRRELEELKAELLEQEDLNGSDEAYKGDIDADESGQFVCSSEACSRQPVQGQRKNGAVRATGDACTNFGHQILEGEFTWKLLPMSWLRTALCHERYPVANSTVFFVGGFAFCFVYSPSAGPIITTTADSKRRCGSLAIRAYDCVEPIALRYSIYVKRSTGDFVQWGATQDEIHPAHELRAYGPDVHPEGSPPQAIGIFGLTHEQLLQSEWVQDDTLTLKLVLEVRLLGVQVTSQRSEREAVDVPKPTLHRDVEALFEDATSGDVQFRVQDEVIHAHSQVLCARSEVLKKQLNSGMQESTSKVIMVEDCAADTFRAFLRFLYTDDLPTLEDLAKLSSQAVKKEGSQPLSQMDALWAVSHKYQVQRLQRWCEAQLCNQLSAEQVCCILRQAHVFEATQLEKACLSYIKDNSAQVLKLQAYSDLISKWPEVALKIHLFTAGVPEAEAAAIVQTRKVRRLNEGAERTS